MGKLLDLLDRFTAPKSTPAAKPERSEGERPKSKPKRPTPVWEKTLYVLLGTLVGLALFEVFVGWLAIAAFLLGIAWLEFIQYRVLPWFGWQVTASKSDEPERSEGEHTPTRENQS